LRFGVDIEVDIDVEVGCDIEAKKDKQ